MKKYHLESNSKTSKTYDLGSIAFLQKAVKEYNYIQKQFPGCTL